MVGDQQGLAQEKDGITCQHAKRCEGLSSAPSDVIPAQDNSQIRTYGRKRQLRGRLHAPKRRAHRWLQRRHKREARHPSEALPRVLAPAPAGLLPIVPAAQQELDRVPTYSLEPWLVSLKCFLERGSNSQRLSTGGGRRMCACPRLPGSSGLNASANHSMRRACRNRSHLCRGQVRVTPQVNKAA